MSNVIGCFRAVGVYPVARRVVLTQLETPGNLLSPKATPLWPFCTPRRNGSPPSTESPPHTPLSRVEMKYFQACLKESTIWSVAANVPPTSYCTCYSTKRCAGCHPSAATSSSTTKNTSGMLQCLCSHQWALRARTARQVRNEEVEARRKRVKRLESEELKKVKEASKMKDTDEGLLCTYN